MISQYIDILYYTMLIILAIRSFLFIKNFGLIAQNFLSIYLLITAFLEIYCLIAFEIDQNSIIGFWYNMYCLFCLFFFRIYYSKFSSSNKLFNIYHVIFILSIIFYFAFTEFCNKDFDIRIGILISIFFISYSLYWFYNKISIFQDDKITDDPNFWVSIAILMWSCFFIFRVIPMFFLNENDKEFLNVLRAIQNFINIIMYIMFYFAIIKYEKKLKLKI